MHQKLIVAERAKKVYVFCVTRRFIIVFTTAETGLRLEPNAFGPQSPSLFL
jgi:hypothetical protein